MEITKEFLPEPQSRELFDGIIFQDPTNLSLDVLHGPPGKCALHAHRAAERQSIAEPLLKRAAGQGECAHDLLDGPAAHDIQPPANRGG